MPGPFRKEISMDRVNVLANALECAKSLKTKHTNGLAFRRAVRKGGDLYTELISEAGSPEAVKNTIDTATEEEKEHAQESLGWTPNPDNVAALLAIIAQIMAMLSESKA